MNHPIHIPIDEQETMITYDYKEKLFHVYTTRGSVYNKLEKKVGKPTRGNIFGADWYFPFEDRETIYSLMTMNLYLPRKNTKW